MIVDWQRGYFLKGFVIGLSGVILGLLYEGINYAYGPFWLYSFSFSLGPDVFYMPLSGYGGYFVFGFDLYASAIFFMSLLKNSPKQIQ